MSPDALIEILLVEDNPGDVLLVKKLLQRGKLKYHLSVATDGQVAMAMLRQEGEHKNTARPDLIILKLNLPKKNGHEVLAEIKADPALKSIPVIILTASIRDRDLEAAYKLGANSYILKPTNLAELEKTTRSIEAFWGNVATLPDRSLAQLGREQKRDSGQASAGLGDV